MEFKIGVQVRVKKGLDETFDSRFEGKTGVIYRENEEGDAWEGYWGVQFNPEDFDPNVPSPDNCFEDADDFKRRLREGLYESFWSEELEPINQ